MTEESTRNDESRDDYHAAAAALEEFLHQPALHADEDSPPPPPNEPESTPTHVGLWGNINNFLFNKRPSGYSSIAPRDAQGRRSKVFFFSGNGRGR